MLTKDQLAATQCGDHIALAEATVQLREARNYAARLPGLLPGQSPEHAQTERIAALSRVEIDVLAALDVVIGNATAARTQLAAMRPALTPEQLATAASIAAQADALPVQELIRQLEGAIFAGDATTAQAWARAAQAATDRAADAGRPIAPETGAALRTLATQARTLGTGETPADQRALYERYGELAAEARELAAQIFTARERRGVATPGRNRGYRYNGEGRRVPLRDSTKPQFDRTGYFEVPAE